LLIKDFLDIDLTFWPPLSRSWMTHDHINSLIWMRLQTRDRIQRWSGNVSDVQQNASTNVTQLHN